MRRRSDTEFSFAPSGLADFPSATHGLRPFGRLRAGCGLHSFAASRLSQILVFPYSSMRIRSNGVTCVTAPDFPLLVRTKLVNFLSRQLPPCTPPHSSGINNSPRAVWWLAGHFSATLVAVRHLEIYRAPGAQLVPATGHRFGIVSVAGS